MISPAEFINENMLHIKSKEIDTRPDGIDFGSKHYQLTLYSRLHKRKYKTYYSVGSMVKSINILDVLELIAMDCSTYIGHSGVQDLMSDFEIDYSTAKRIWKACKKTNKKLKEFFGEDFEQFLSLEF